MSTQAQRVLSPEEYLELERAANFRSEYLAGETFAMAGASPRHALIVTNLVTALDRQLGDRPCFVFSTDLRLRVSPTGLFTYPDVMVACGEMRFADEQRDTLLNPIVIVEVLSESTKDYDRGSKFAHYRALDSLQVYLLVEQERPHVELYLRQSDGRWILSETDRLDDVLDLAPIGCRLSVAELYRKLDLIPQERIKSRAKAAGQPASKGK